MEFCEVFHFFIILKDSIKLLAKNWKFMASITILSLLLPSILIFLFRYPFQSLLDNITSYRSLWALLAIEIVFLLAYLALSHLSAIATILVSSKSYSGKNLSLQDLFSDIKRTWRCTLSTGFRLKNYSYFIGVASALLVILYPNRFTICIAIFVWIVILVYQLYLSVVWVLSFVVSIVEEGYQGKEALEKAEKLVKGQRLHGFMLNLFFNLLVLISFPAYWITFADKGFVNTILFFVNFSSLVRIFVSMAYTVFYFQCKKHHGEEVEILGDFNYTKLPAASLGSDIP
ncbi:hypothetical protein CDL12_04223 [Handroanthus impetiginosus]|uniref:Uncharacterized protein n=1 Tax=Handroanthus impetiginosus TaxID=429701 RepID=A0A2G9G0U4_9LAMI|nr:hypothetical protein CDL12_28567 [Handroanthus impetiginosus]PIN23064.1 hypothetical protein CDL12_04223 [Handroanthus impetiginosus]